MEKRKVRYLKLISIKYCLIDQDLYWKDPLWVLLRCLDLQEAQKIMFDFHDSLCGGHHFWRTTSYKILRAGYFWPSLFTDVCAKIRACLKCKKFSEKTVAQILAFEACGSFRTLSAMGPRIYWGYSSYFKWSA